MSAKAKIQDHPGIVTAGILVPVCIHGAVGLKWPGITLLPAISDQTEIWQLYLGISGLAAMIAGFAGVVVVFAMTPGIGRLRRLRVKGGKRLEANLLSPVTTSFFAAFLAAGAATLEAAGASTPAVWMFEAGLLVSAHGALRLLWLLQALVAVVRAQDREDLQAPASLEDTIRVGA